MSEDTAEIAAWVIWENEENLLMALDQYQQQAKANRYKREETDALTTEWKNPTTKQKNLFDDPDLDEPAENGDSDAIELGEVYWRVWPNGAGGSGRGNLFFPYMMSAGGMRIGIRPGSAHLCNVKFEIGSIPLAQKNGLTAVWQFLGKVIGEMGGRITKHSLSRVDPYTDVTTPVLGFCDRFSNDQWIGRARNIGEFEDIDGNYSGAYRNGRRKTGFKIGGALMLRIYDKIWEMRNNPVKRSIFGDRYGGELPTELTRVEFQLRRSVTREKMVAGERMDTVEEYERNKPYLWRYLTQEWFRMTEYEVDRKNKNQSKAKTWSLWNLIAKAGERPGDDGSEYDENGVLLRVFKVPTAGDVDMDQLEAQSISCQVKAAIWGNRLIASAEDYVSSVVAMTKKYGDAYFASLGKRFLIEREQTVLEEARYG